MAQNQPQKTTRKVLPKETSPDPVESPLLQPTQLTGHKHVYTQLREDKITYLEVTTLGGPRDYIAIPLEYVPVLMQELAEAYRFFKRK